MPRMGVCVECGRSLRFDAVCGACSAANPAHYRFCDACGTKLVPQPRTAAADGPAAAAQDPAWPRPPIAVALRLPDPGLVWELPAPQWRWRWSHVAAWAKRNRIELAVVALLTLVAGLLRIYGLTELRGGLHGDEAHTGLDALRVIEEGWIGPYVGSALGQTTGPLYFTALVFSLSEPTSFTLHLSMALLGVATVPASYLLFRIGFGRWVALFSTVALTFSYWHLFYSRSAFMLISMPLMTTLAAAAILIALRSTTRWAWFTAGIALGLGVYSYNGYLMFIVATAVLIATVLVLGRDRLRHYAAGAAVLTAGFLIAAFPLIRFAYSDPDFYLYRFRYASVLRDQDFQEARTLGERAAFWTGRARDAAVLPLSHPEIDYGDAMGGRGAMDPVLALLAYAGLGIAMARWRSPPHLLAAVAFVSGLAVLLLGEENQGEMRRAFIVLPFAYGLAGVAAIAGVRWLTGLVGGPGGRTLAYAAAAAVLALAVSLNLWTYFGRIVNEDHVDWVFATDMVDALDAAHRFDEPGTIYFYSERWSYNYETRRFLYPDTPGIDRSRTFGDFSLQKLHEGPVTYVMFPPYTAEVDLLLALHPGGEASEARTEEGNIRFFIYHLP